MGKSSKDFTSSVSGTPYADPPPNAALPTPGQGLVLDLIGRVPLSVLPQFVTGRVSSAGAVDGGTGFGVSRSAAGTYVVTFTVPFKTVPVLLVTLVAPRGAACAVDSATAPTVSGFKVWTFDTATAALTDESFHFHALAVS